MPGETLGARVGTYSGSDLVANTRCCAALTHDCGDALRFIAALVPAPQENSSTAISGSTGLVAITWDP